MSIFKCLMLPGARRRAERRERRHAFRAADNAIAEVKARQAELEKEAKKQWELARTAMKNGEKAAANRALVSFRAAQTMVMKLEQKRWVFEQYFTKMQMAESDNQFAAAMGALNKVISIDPAAVENVFDAAQDALGEQVEADKFWNEMYAKEMTGATGALQDVVPSMEEMASQLEQEVAAEVGSAANAATATDATLSARIAAGQQRVKEMLEGK